MIFSPIFAVPTWNPNTSMSLVEWIGLAIVAIAIVGESTDWQLARFKNKAPMRYASRDFDAPAIHSFQWIAGWVSSCSL